MEYTTLDKISENLDSKRKPITSSDRVEGEIPYYGASGIVDYVKDYIFDEVLLLVSEDGANLLARSTPIAFSVSGKTWINNHAHVLRFSNKNLQKFVEIYLNSISLESYVTGSAQPKLNQKMLNEIPIPVVEDSQIEIVVNLAENLKSIIELRKQELSCFDDLIKARFVEMFNLNNCKREALGDCTDFVDYRGHTPELSEEGTIRMVNAKSVGKGFFKYIDEYITEETYGTWMHRGFAFPGDILFVTEGHTFGNTCIIPEDMTKFALGQRVITIKGHDEVENAFLCSYMQTDMFWKDINVYRTGGTAQGIRSKDLVKISIPVPPKEQQVGFKNFVHQVDKSKFKESCYIKYKILKIRHHQIYLLRK